MLVGLDVILSCECSRMFLDLQTEARVERALLWRKLSTTKPEDKEELLQGCDQSWAIFLDYCFIYNKLQHGNIMSPPGLHSYTN